MSDGTISNAYHALWAKERHHMRITLKELESLYDAVSEDLRTALELKDGATRIRKLHEILRCTENLSSLATGSADPSHLIELAQPRAPTLHRTLLDLVLGGDAVVRGKFDKLNAEAQAIEAHRAFLRQEEIRLEADKASLSFEKDMLNKQKEYLELESKKLKMLAAQTGAVIADSPVPSPTNPDGEDS